MLSFDEACRVIQSHCQPLGAVRCLLGKASGRVLAEPFTARSDSPPFDNSSVDGYGLHREDCGQPTGHETLVVGEIAAGDSSITLAMRPAKAVRIFTGAPVPPGCAGVVMQEDVDILANSAIRLRESVAVGENIRLKGEAFRRGETLLEPGERITPAHLGLIASQGVSSLRVVRQPKVAVVITGSELGPLGKPLKTGQIYDANGPALEAACRQLGLSEVRIFHAKDSLKATRRILSQVLGRYDSVITVGGISVGDYDFVQQGLEALGVQTRFWRINLKPGKPVYFGTYQKTPRQRASLVFGLPGNPVSALVTFSTLVAPALRSQQGVSNPWPHWQSARLLASLKPAGERMTLLRAELLVDEQTGELTALPVLGQESHMLNGLARANGLIRQEAGSPPVSSGESVLVQRLAWQI